MTTTTLYAPEGCKSICLSGNTIEVSDDGTIEAPHDVNLSDLAMHGFTLQPRQDGAQQGTTGGAGPDQGAANTNMAPSRLGAPGEAGKTTPPWANVTN